MEFTEATLRAALSVVEKNQTPEAARAISMLKAELEGIELKEQQKALVMKREMLRRLKQDLLQTEKCERCGKPSEQGFIHCDSCSEQLVRENEAQFQQRIAQQNAHNSTH